MRSFHLAGMRCTFAQDPARNCSSSPCPPLVESAHLLSDALQAEQAEVAHFQEATHRLECQMHALLRACEGYLSACQTIDTNGLRQEAERSAAIFSCPHALRSPSSST